MTLPTSRETRLLGALGQAIRRRREAQGLTQRELAKQAKLSLRYLAMAEGGQGNLSLERFVELAQALHTSGAALLAECEAQSPRGPLIALLGLRGAGKSTIGRRLARRLRVPFVEIDQEIERAAGLTLGEIFELHGGEYYRRLERETLTRLLDTHRAAVLATGGSIVTDRDTYRLLRERATTVWLRARPEDHWNRVLEQGDSRPMDKNPQAFAQLRRLLAARGPLYQQADHMVDTHALGIDRAVDKLSQAFA